MGKEESGETLADALPKAIADAKDLLLRYKEMVDLGHPYVKVGMKHIQDEIEKAERAIREGDTVQMIRSLVKLRECA
ncbi:MAG: hypothetical protein M0R06_02840 [Sphaerochaeta sp.]|nr:hypothetical protein [Sphaerochaeta sp.]